MMDLDYLAWLVDKGLDLDLVGICTYELHLDGPYCRSNAGG
jgi:hypothetical protein